MKRFVIIILVALGWLPMAAQLQGTGYYRVANKLLDENNDTLFISFANDKFSYQFLFGGSSDTYFNKSPQVCGGLSNLKDHTNTVKPVVVNGAGAFLKNDIHLVNDKDCIDPSTIIYLQKGSGSKYNIIGQGTSLLTLTTGVYEASVRLIFKEIYATISTSSATISSSSPYTVSVDINVNDVENIKYNSLAFALGKSAFISMAKLGSQYFTNDDGVFTINSSSSNNNAKWEIKKVTRFNVKPTLEYKGKYYTTLYVPFAYTIAQGSDVCAAYVITGINDDGTLEKSVIASTSNGEVPAGTPVVLECSSNDVTKCYLNLKTTEAPLYTAPNTANDVQYCPAASSATNYSGNLLKGTYYQNEDEPYSYQYSRDGSVSNSTIDLHNTTAYDENSMYVLGVGSYPARLGFFKNTNTIMKGNKVWLDISGSNANANYTFDTDEPNQKGVTNE
jgi:hypothetical protein